MADQENLVSKIPEEKQKEITAEVCRDYDRDLKARASWQEKRDKWYKLWTTYREPKTDPWPDCANICVPFLAMSSNQFASRAYQSIFAPPGMVKCIPTGQADYKHAKDVEQFMNWQTLYEMEEYEEVFDKLLQQLPVNGTSFKKLHYFKEDERPMAEYISALDLILPYKTKDLKSARRKAHRIWLHWEEILDRQEQNLWENVDKLKEVAEAEDKSDLAQTAAEQEGVQKTPEIEEDKPHLILECHKKYEWNNGQREPMIFTVDYDTETLVRAASRIFTQGSEKKVLEYFIDYHFLPNPEGFYSFGFGHFLEPLIEMMNTAFNQIFDSGRLTNQPFGFYGRRSGIKQRKIKLEPGAMYEIEDATQIAFPRMQAVDQVLFMVLGLIKDYIEQFTSTSDYLMGREARGTKTPTAHGTLAIIEQGLVTFGVITKRIFRSLRKELRLLMTLNNLFLPDKKEFYIMEGEDKIAFPDIKRETFAGIRDVIPIGDPSYASKQVRRQEAMELYTILMQNPLVVQNPRSIYEITSDLIDAYDKKNKSKILPPLPEDTLSPEMENAMFMQGDKPKVTANENAQQHLIGHNNFLNTDFFNLMANEHKKNFLEHVRQTKELVLLQQGQRQTVGMR